MENQVDKKLLREGIDHDGFSPMIYAIINGHTRCVQIFLEYGASIEQENIIGHVPLSLACQFGHVDIARFLLSKGAVLSVKDNEGLFPLHLACREGHAEIALLLVNHAGADIAKELRRKDLYTGCMKLLSNFTFPRGTNFLLCK